MYRLIRAEGTYPGALRRKRGMYPTAIPYENERYPDRSAAGFVHLPNNFSFKALALNCGCYDLMRRVENNPSHKEVVSLYLPCGWNEDGKKLVSVCPSITKKYPPVFLMTSSHDFLKDQAPLLASALAEKNVPFEFHFYADRSEKLYHVFHLDVRSPFAKKCNDEECAFFKSFMGISKN